MHTWSHPCMWHHIISYHITSTMSISRNKRNRYCLLHRRISKYATYPKATWITPSPHRMCRTRKNPMHITELLIRGEKILSPFVQTGKRAKKTQWRGHVRCFYSLLAMPVCRWPTDGKRSEESNCQSQWLTHRRGVIDSSHLDQMTNHFWTYLELHRMKTKRFPYTVSIEQCIFYALRI